MLLQTFSLRIKLQRLLQMTMCYLEKKVIRIAYGKICNKSLSGMCKCVYVGIYAMGATEWDRTQRKHEDEKASVSTHPSRNPST